MLKWFSIGSSWHCGKILPVQCLVHARESRCGEIFRAYFTILTYDAPPALNESLCKKCLGMFKTVQEITDLRKAIEKRNANGSSSGSGE